MVWLSFYREKENLTRHGLDALAGVGRNTAYNIEVNGTSPSVGTALKYARALGVSVEDLFDETRNPYQWPQEKDPSAQQAAEPQKRRGKRNHRQLRP